jgi:uncharacterized membrane protein YsdA (DUF1294 family)
MKATLKVMAFFFIGFVLMHLCILWACAFMGDGRIDEENVFLVLMTDGLIGFWSAIYSIEHKP